jgi:hypothetical protein
MPKGDEHVVLQEKCREDNGHEGTLTLTDAHLTFETESGHFSKKKVTEFSADLSSVQNVWIEGRLTKKLAVEVNSSKGNPNTPETIEKRKFHVSQPGEWETKIKSAQQRQPHTTTTTTTTTTKQES